MWHIPSNELEQLESGDEKVGCCVTTTPKHETAVSLMKQYSVKIQLGQPVAKVNSLSERILLVICHQVISDVCNPHRVFKAHEIIKE